MAKAKAARRTNPAVAIETPILTIGQLQKRIGAPHFLRQCGINEQDGSVDPSWDDASKAEAKAAWKIVKGCGGREGILSVQIAEVAKKTGKTIADVRDFGVIEFAKALVSKSKPAATVARYIGNRKVKIDDDAPIVLAEQFDHVLCGLLELGGSAETAALVRQTGKDSFARVL